MRPLYKSHGRHCYLRSYHTSCPKCGADVLYWECLHGSKVFFEYPPYGKLIKHVCKRYKGKNRERKYPVIIKKPIKLLENASPSCPMCGKLFKTESDLHNHLKGLKKYDFQHKSIFEDKILLMNEKSKKKYDIINTDYKPKFGRINIKKRDQ